ncbi:MAG: hypothetical protein QXX20_05130 [Candidatus Thermoplasmatota archaeon]
MNKILVLGSIVLVGISAFSLLVGAHTMHQKTSDLLGGYETITFTIYEGGGCGCVPIYNATVSAIGRTTSHNTVGSTNDDGQCILALEYDETYRIHINADGFHTVLFDVNIVDDQMFSFHLEKTDDAISLRSILLQHLVQRIPLMKRFIPQ